jgi:hypothetical protein
LLQLEVKGEVSLKYEGVVSMLVRGGGVCGRSVDVNITIIIKLKTEKTEGLFFLGGEGNTRRDKFEGFCNLREDGVPK